MNVSTVDAAIVKTVSVPLHALNESIIPTSPKFAEVEHEGVLFRINRPHPSDQNHWRGFVVYEVDMTEYFAAALGDVRQWVRLVAQTINEMAAKKKTV